MKPTRMTAEQYFTEPAHVRELMELTGQDVDILAQEIVDEAWEADRVALSLADVVRWMRAQKEQA